MQTPTPELYKSDNYLVLDFETNGLEATDPWSEASGITLACWYYKGKMYYKFGNEYEQLLLLQHIDECDFIVAHNAKFELGFLARCGHDIGSKPVFCTQVAQYVLYGNRRAPLTLNATAHSLGLGEQKMSVVDTLIKKGVDTREIPEEWLRQYCIQDVYLCMSCFHRQRDYLDGYGLWNVFASRAYLTPVITDIERRGIQLDQVRVEKAYVDSTTARERLREEVVRITGGINTNSTQQLGEYLYETLEFSIPKDGQGGEIRTPSGDRSCSKEAIDALKPSTERQREFLKAYRAVRKLDSIISKYLTKMLECCEEAEGILKGNFNQTITRTHRLSSTGKTYNIQLQNIPRHLKKLIKARKEGWSIVEIDYSQLEFRIAVDLCDDIQGRQDILTKRDVHAATATVIFNDFKGADKATRKALRTRAKAFTFRPLFGGGSGTPEEERYYKSFRRRYAGIIARQKEWVNEAGDSETNELVLPTGLRFFYPNLKRHYEGSSYFYSGTTQLKNAPIQNFASAEVTLLAVGLIWRWLRDNKKRSFIVLTVHDSIILECPDEERDEVITNAEFIMTKEVPKLIKQLYDYDLTVPLEVESEYGKHWGS